MINEAHAVQAALHLVCPHLSFPRTMMKKAMTFILGKVLKKFSLTEAEQDSYVPTMTNRLMNICHVVQQGHHKKTKAEWYTALPWVAAGQDHSDAAAEHTASDAGAEENEHGETSTCAETAPGSPTRPIDWRYKFDIDGEANLEYRWDPSATSMPIEYALRMIAPTSGDGGDMMVAAYEDGTLHTTAMLYKDFKLYEGTGNQQEGDGAQPSNLNLKIWNGKHKQHNHNILVHFKNVDGRLARLSMAA